MHEITQLLAESITTFITNYGYIAIFILMTAESALIPIPSEVTMPFAGFMVGLGSLDFWIVVFVGAFGNLVGSWMAYYLGYKKGENWILKTIDSYGKYLLLRKDDYFKSKKWFEKYGQGIAFFSRLLPIVRTFISLPAGIAKMEIKKFSIFTFLGSFLWCIVLTYVGVVLGQNWTAIEPFFRKFQIVIILIGVIFVAWYIRRHIKLLKQDKLKEEK